MKRVRSRAKHRVERIGDATLYLAGWEDVIGSLSVVDAVLSDPPYDDNTHRHARTNIIREISALGVDFAALVNVDFLPQMIELTRGWLLFSARWR